MTRRLLLALAAFGFAASALAQQPFVEAVPTKDAPLRFQAIAVNMQGGRMGMVDIVVERWTAPAERDALLAIVAKSTKGAGGQDDLRDALQDIKPRVGYIRTPNSMGWDLKYAWQRKLEDGSRQIVIVTDKPVTFFGVASGSRTLDYPFTLVDMRFPAGSDKGEGKLLNQTSISTKNNTLELELWGREPTRLTTITEKNPKTKN
jgi:hypothetical protein